MDSASNHAAVQSGAGSAPERPAPPAPAGAANEPILHEVSEAEIDAWAEGERRRREQWVSGPTAEERAAWTQRERGRRPARREAETASEAPDRAHRAQRALREAQLATEGAVGLVRQGLRAGGPAGLAREWWRRGLAALVRAGYDWEAEYGQPVRGRRDPMDDDVP
jgi:hypothetical protein